jgi:protein involved in ribonucleotide reduction
MKNLLYIILLSIFFPCCQKQEIIENIPTVFKVEATGLTLSGNINTVDSVVIQSNISWTASITTSNTTWLKLNRTSGTGSNTIFITIIEKNTTSSSRSATLRITPDDASVQSIEITLTQNSISSELITDKRYINLEGIKNATDTFHIQSNISWTITGIAPWFTLNITGGTDSSKIIVTATDDNTQQSSKTAILTITPIGNNSVPAISIYVVQKTMFVENVSVDWSRLFGGASDDYVHFIQATPDGGYLLAGETTSSDGDVIGAHGNRDAFIIKVDANGNKQWSKPFGGSGNDYAKSITTTTDGGYVFVGHTDSNNEEFITNKGKVDFWVVKIDGSGNKIWSKTFGGTENDNARSIVAQLDGTLIVAGTTTSNNGDIKNTYGGSDVLVIKLSGEGNIIWTKTYGYTGDEEVWDMASTSDGGYVIAGGTHENYNIDALVVKIDAEGNLQWMKKYGDTSYDIAWSISESPVGDFVLAGHSMSHDGRVNGGWGKPQAWIFKIDKIGNHVWTKKYGPFAGSTSDVANSIVATPDGSYVFVANIQGTPRGQDGMIMKLDPNGNTVWEKYVGGGRYDYAESIISTIDGGFAIGGFTESGDGDFFGNHGKIDAFILKIKIQ